MRLFLGVDGGQSSTTAYLGDDSGRVIGYGHSGPCNHVASGDGRAKFSSALQGSVQAALRQAGLPYSISFVSACLGLSGGPADKQRLAAELLQTDRLKVTHDALIALVGALAGAPGVIVIAGTGSIAFGRNAQAREARAGGWGYIYGDEGGAFDIARQAVRAALRMEEGWGAGTALRDLLLQTTGAANADDLLHRLYTPEFTRPAIAEFAQLADMAASQGDSVAQEILHRAAQDLALLGASVRQQLFGEDEPLRLAPVGGVFRNAALAQRFRLLVELGTSTECVSPAYSPAAGALIEAYREAGISITLSQVPQEKETE